MALPSARVRLPTTGGKTNLVPSDSNSRDENLSITLRSRFPSILKSKTEDKSATYRPQTNLLPSSSSHAPTPASFQSPPKTRASLLSSRLYAPVPTVSLSSPLRTSASTVTLVKSLTRTDFTLDPLSSSSMPAPRNAYSSTSLPPRSVVPTAGHAAPGTVALTSRSVPLAAEQVSLAFLRDCYDRGILQSLNVPVGSLQDGRKVREWRKEGRTASDATVNDAIREAAKWMMTGEGKGWVPSAAAAAAAAAESYHNPQTNNNDDDSNSNINNNEIDAFAFSRRLKALKYRVRVLAGKGSSQVSSMLDNGLDAFNDNPDPTLGVPTSLLAQLNYKTHHTHLPAPEGLSAHTIKTERQATERAERMFGGTNSNNPAQAATHHGLTSTTFKPYANATSTTSSVATFKELQERRKEENVATGDIWRTKIGSKRIKSHLIGEEKSGENEPSNVKIMEKGVFSGQQVTFKRMNGFYNETLYRQGL